MPYDVLLDCPEETFENTNEYISHLEERMLTIHQWARERLHFSSEKMRQVQRQDFQQDFQRGSIILNRRKDFLNFSIVGRTLQDQALATIALSISTEQQIHIIDCDTAREAWATLEQILEPKSRVRILQLKKQFVNIKFIE
ncbi:hypothetical protein LAZ67_X001308 [Cordylochernes scorpioides]|uniref:Uncharacterized protein n=1 Tax=Cordylochernes scorpioides TaxID=51811 RepID=A0ABY6LUX2_9ARAC|nr:hypothetical protein LAZ67_X001308 [Cordylochernes scorpioides]